MYIKSELCISESIVLNRANSHYGEGKLNGWDGVARHYPNLLCYGRNPTQLHAGPERLLMWGFKGKLWETAVPFIKYNSVILR